ncbi:tripartite tricarboxylate transporter permease, partial [Candidatus Woesearchaeota archaeon]|nr:tripartite tricarboxylate transporter permease [Candidatus Woesearchaeota archaeon]
FVDVLPAVFLGAPSPGTSLLVLPAHRLLSRGYGYEAVRMATIGGLISVLILSLFSPLVCFVLKHAYPVLELFMGQILLCFIAFFILRNHTWRKRFWALVVFLLSGTLGLIVLNSPCFKQPIFPMLTGLFGISLLMRCLFIRSEIGKQFLSEDLSLPPTALIKSVLGANIGGLITGIFPGIGSAQAAILGKSIFRHLGTLGFIVLNGGVNTINFFVSLFTLQIVGKARNGAVLTLKHFIPLLSLKHLVLFVFVVLFASGLSCILVLVYAKLFCRLVNVVNYRLLSLGVIILLLFFTLRFSGLLGILVLLVGSAIGLIPNIMGVGKSNCMGCVLLPVLIYFLL